MSIRIVVNPGTEQAWEILLRPGLNRIGSSAENDFIINHPSISPQHCELWVSDAGVLLKDPGSASGTFVHGAPVREVWLQSGEHIQFGAVDSVFESRQPASIPPPVNQPAPGATIVVATFGSPPSSGSPSVFNPPAEATRSGQEGTQQSLPSQLEETSGRPKKFPVHFAAECEAERRKRFILGAAGAVAGSLIGVLIWFLLIKSTGSPLLVIAWGVGGLTGLGAMLLAKHGGLPLGVLSAICALAGIVAGECLAASAIREQEATRRANVAYRVQLEFAKEALRAESPEEFRKLLAQVNGTTAEEVTDDQIKAFQDEELPRLRKFALGKPSRAEFVAEQQPLFAEEFSYKNYLAREDLKSGLFLVLFAGLGIATAYQVGSGRKPAE
ncbi:MAG TPA: FHA domain-containing protein [Verrucomicrobiae bacterium]|nr:FHA domain-containing protein [Verrucomicrobiae bacterium]